MDRLRPRIDLNVAYDEKENVKALKTEQVVVLWDPAVKRWYVPEGKPSWPFEKWMPHPVGNIRWNDFFLARAMTACWKCHSKTDVSAIILPQHEAFVVDEKNGLEFWRHHPQAVMLNYVSWIHPDVEAVIQRHLPSNRYRLSNGYMTNHCTGCDARQSDVYLFNQPGHAFSPGSIDDAKEIDVLPISHEFVGVAGSSGLITDYLMHFCIMEG